jgi:hypothetical protein
MPDPLPKLAVAIPEACHMIGVGETLLREMMTDGRLRYSRIAKKGKRGRILIRVADLDKLIDKTAVRP